MNSLFESEHLSVRAAKIEEIEWVMSLERKEENKEYIFQGSYKDHQNEINNPSTYLCVIEQKNIHKKIGFFIGEYDAKNDVFEFRRFVMDVKNQGFGTELTKSLMAYAFHTLKINRFWLDVFTYNSAGIHIYEKLGLKRDGIIREGYKDNNIYKSYYIYSILKNEYNT